MEGVTLGIALLGAVLGVFNTWRAWNNDRVKLRVRPVLGAGLGLFEGKRMVGVSITNLGNVDVTITEAGFLSDGEARLAFIDSLNFPGVSLPHQLVSRTSITCYAELSAFFEVREKFSVTYAFAKTACGLTFRSRKPFDEGDKPKEIIKRGF